MTEIVIYQDQELISLKDQINKSAARITLLAGNKRMYLILNGAGNMIQTQLRRIKDDEPSAPGLTTAIYRRASELMQETANMLDRPLDYLFNTRIESEESKMEQWAIDSSKGLTVFVWDNAGREERDGVTWFMARKQIWPSVSSDR
jgi:hypothetical protein